MLNVVLNIRFKYNIQIKFIKQGSIIKRFVIGVTDLCHLKLMEAIWIYKRNLVTLGINERDEATPLNQHIMQSSTHFQHSPTCLPYILFHTTSVTLNPLLKFKRHNILHATKQARLCNCFQHYLPSCTTMRTYSPIAAQLHNHTRLSQPCSRKVAAQPHAQPYKRATPQQVTNMADRLEVKNVILQPKSKKVLPAMSATRNSSTNRRQVDK